MIIDRAKANHRIQRQYVKCLYAEGEVTDILNTTLQCSLWSWEVKLTVQSCNKYHVLSHLIKRAYKLHRQKFKSSQLPSVGDRVLLECRLTAINKNFKPERAKIVAIIQ